MPQIFFRMLSTPYDFHLRACSHLQPPLTTAMFSCCREKKKDCPHQKLNKMSMGINSWVTLFPLINLSLKKTDLNVENKTGNLSLVKSFEKVFPANCVCLCPLLFCGLQWSSNTSHLKRKTPSSTKKQLWLCFNCANEFQEATPPPLWLSFLTYKIGLILSFFSIIDFVVKISKVVV